MERPTKRQKFEQTNVTGLDEYRLNDMQDADVYYFPDFIEQDVAQEWYTELSKLDSWYRPNLKVFGKTVVQSRKIAAYATDPTLTLKYSGQVVDMRYDYPTLLREIQDKVEERLGVTFNHVLLNLYEDGTVYIGNHRDNIENKVIASVSLGAPRTFIMTYDKPSDRRKKREQDGPPPNSGQSQVRKKQWTLESGSLVVMQGDTQRFWKHEIPREPNIRQGRISLTFRQLIYDT